MALHILLKAFVSAKIESWEKIGENRGKERQERDMAISILQFQFQLE